MIPVEFGKHIKDKFRSSHFFNELQPCFVWLRARQEPFFKIASTQFPIYLFEAIRVRLRGTNLFHAQELNKGIVSFVRPGTAYVPRSRVNANRAGPPLAHRLVMAGRALSILRARYLEEFWNGDSLTK